MAAADGERGIIVEYFALIRQSIHTGPTVDGGYVISRRRNHMVQTAPSAATA